MNNNANAESTDRDVRVLKRFFDDLLTMCPREDVLAAMTLAMGGKANAEQGKDDELSNRTISHHKLTAISLPDLYMAKVERYDHVYTIHVRKNLEDIYQGTIKRDGEKVCDIISKVGKCKTVEMAKKALTGYCFKSERKLRKSARRAAREGKEA